MFDYVVIDIGNNKMLVKEMYAEEMQGLINDILILSKFNNGVKIREIVDTTQIVTSYGFEIKIEEKHSIFFSFNSNNPSIFKDKREIKKIDGFYCDYSIDMKKHLMFKNDFSIQHKKGNNSFETVSFSTMIKVLDTIKEIIKSV